MADSDNSRTLPTVTRRQLLSTSAVWLGAQVANVDAALATVGEERGDSDPVLFFWREWMTAHAEAERLCRAQQRLESQMMRVADFPHVEVTVTDKEPPVSAFSTEEIDRLLGGETDQADARARAKVALAERQKTWDTLDEGLGYSCAKQAEVRAFAVRDECANALWAEPARSCAGVAAKLHAILCMGREDGSDEFPWSQINAALLDIIAVGAGDSN